MQIITLGFSLKLTKNVVIFDTSDDWRGLNQNELNFLKAQDLCYTKFRMSDTADLAKDELRILLMISYEQMKHKRIKQLYFDKIMKLVNEIKNGSNLNAEYNLRSR